MMLIFLDLILLGNLLIFNHKTAADATLILPKASVFLQSFPVACFLETNDRMVPKWICTPEWLTARSILVQIEWEYLKVLDQC